MENKVKIFFIDYLKLVRKITTNKTFQFVSSILLVAISTIFLNIFTGNEAIQNFSQIENNLSFYAQLVFYMGFGLIASFSLIKACISLAIIGGMFFIIGIFVKLILDLYKWFLSKIKEELSLILNIIFILLETILALYLLFFVYKGNHLSLIPIFILIILATETLKEISKKVIGFEQNP